MAQPPPTVMADSVSKFLLISEERAEPSRDLSKRFDDEMVSLLETITVLQSRLDVLEARPANWDPAAVKRLEQDVMTLQETVNSLQGRANKAEARVSQIETDNTRLQNENAEISGQNAEILTALGHAEGMLAKAQASLAQNPGKHPRPPESRQPTTQLREPQRQTLRTQRFEDADEQGNQDQILEEPLRIQSPRERQNHSRSNQKTRSFERLRGVKRSLVDDDGDAGDDPPPRRKQPVQASSDKTLGFEQAQDPRARQMKVAEEIVAHVEAPGRGKKRVAREKDTVERQEQVFTEWYRLARSEYDKGKHWKNQRAFICQFIDGIGDKALSHWFQEVLMEDLPKKVRQAKQPPRKAGHRIVALDPNLTWEEVKGVIQELRFPSSTD